MPCVVNGGTALSDLESILLDSGRNDKDSGRRFKRGKHTSREDNSEEDGDEMLYVNSENGFHLAGPKTQQVTDKLQPKSAAAKTKRAVLRAVSKFRERNRRHIAAHDEHTMSPFAKFRHYGRFPCKFTLNVIIFALLTFVIIAFELPASIADESERKVLQLHFINAVVGDSNIVPRMPGDNYIVEEPTIYLFERSEVLGAIERIVELYYSLSGIALIDFDMLFNDKGPDGWVPPNVSSSTSSGNVSSGGSSVSRPFSSSSVVRQEKTPTGTWRKDGGGGGDTNAVVSRRAQRARDYLGSQQMDHVHNRRTVYIPAPPLQLSNDLQRVFEELSVPSSTENQKMSSLGASSFGITNGPGSYYEYVRGLYAANNISDKNIINNDWMLQPILELYMLGTSARVDWMAETFALEFRSFYLARNSSLGPFRTDIASLPNASDDAIADEVDKPAGGPLNLPSTATPDTNTTTPQADWVNVVCAPRADPFFIGSYYLPCRLPPLAPNTTQDDDANATRRGFAAQDIPSSSTSAGSGVASRPRGRSSRGSSRSHGLLRRQNRFRRSQSKSFQTVGVPQQQNQPHPHESLSSGPSRRGMRTSATTVPVAPGEPAYHSITPMGIFDQSERFRIRFRIHQICSVITSKNDDPIALFYRDALYFWEIDVSFATSLNGQVAVTFPVRHDVKRSYQTFHVTFLAIMAIGILSVWDAVLRVRAIRRIFRYRHLLRKKMKEHLLRREEERLREEEEEQTAALAEFFQGRRGDGHVPSSSSSHPPSPAPSIPTPMIHQENVYSPPLHQDGGGHGVEGNQLDAGLLSPRTHPPPSSQAPRGNFWGSVVSAVVGSQRSANGTHHLLSADQLNDDLDGIKYVLPTSHRNNNEGAGDGDAKMAKSSAKEIEEAKFHRRWKKSLRADMGMSWHLWSIFTDMLCLVYVWYTTAASLQVSATLESARTLHIIIGLAVAGNAVLFVSYLRFFPNLYFMIRATSGSAARLSSFLLGVFPIYFGFAVFFTTVTGDVATGHFASIFTSFSTLCFAWFGDALFPDFEALEKTSFVHVRIATNVMLFIFIAMAICVVLNLMLAIVIDSYTDVRKTYGLTIAPQDWFKRKLPGTKCANTTTSSSSATKSGNSEQGKYTTTKRGLLAATARHRMRDDSMKEVQRHLAIIAATFDSSEEEAEQKQKKVVAKTGRKARAHTADAGVDRGGPREADDIATADHHGGSAVSSPTSPSQYSSSAFEEGDKDEAYPDDDDDVAEVREELQEGSFEGLMVDPDMDMGLLTEFKRTTSRQD